jgi:hypothetical protein
MAVCCTRLVLAQTATYGSHDHEIYIDTKARRSSIWCRAEEARFGVS